MVFEETELRLGLPGNGGDVVHHHQQGVGDHQAALIRKRGFSESESSDESGGNTVDDHDLDVNNQVDLKLNLSSKDNHDNVKAANNKTINMLMQKDNNNLLIPSDPAKPPAKAQVVGWPPVRSFRKNMMAVQKSSAEESEKLSLGGALVKVSMDGAPYLRKVDLNMYKNYKDLSDALGKLFSTIGNCGSQGMKDFMNESKLMDVLNGSDYVPTYEDKDGDWMLVGDVPWEMFVESCKRLRIMKGKEAVGLAPRAMDKCKNRS